MTHSGFIRLTGRRGPVKAVQHHDETLLSLGYEVKRLKSRIVVACAGFVTRADLGAGLADVLAHLRQFAAGKLLLTYDGSYTVNGREYTGLQLIKQLSKAGKLSATALVVHPHKTVH